MGKKPKEATLNTQDSWIAFCNENNPFLIKKIKEIERCDKNNSYNTIIVWTGFCHQSYLEEIKTAHLPTGAGQGTSFLMLVDISCYYISYWKSLGLHAELVYNKGHANVAIKCTVLAMMACRRKKLFRLSHVLNISLKDSQMCRHLITGQGEQCWAHLRCWWLLAEK